MLTYHVIITVAASATSTAITYASVSSKETYWLEQNNEATAMVKLAEKIYTPEERGHENHSLV